MSRSLVLPQAPSLKRAYTKDHAFTFDRQTIDGTGVFLIGELERLDQTLHMPLASYKWSRDIDLREDVSIADEVSSFTNSTFAAAGGISPNGVSWISKSANAIPGIELDIGKTAHGLPLWGQEISYTIPELESAQRLGRPVDAQKFEGMQLKHNMDIDQLVYTGDTVMGSTGLVNSYGSGLPVTNQGLVANTGSGSTTQWINKTPAQILADVNELLTSAWNATGYAICPSRLLLPPTQYGYIATTTVSTAGSVSILKYLEDNSISLRVNGKPLEVLESKWLPGAGQVVSSVATDRMVAYTKEKRFVRYPLVPLQRTPLEYRSIFHITTYFGRMGQVEFVYPETIGYRDGI